MPLLAGCSPCHGDKVAGWLAGGERREAQGHRLVATRTRWAAVPLLCSPLLLRQGRQAAHQQVIGQV